MAAKKFGQLFWMASASSTVMSLAVLSAAAGLPLTVDDAEAIQKLSLIHI